MILGDANLVGLTNGSTAQNNIGSLVNLSGSQPMASQTLTSTVPTAGNTHPLIGNTWLNVFILFILLCLSVNIVRCLCLIS